MKDADDKPVCPICRLPAKQCSFFARCEKVKMDDEPDVSAAKRSDMFRRFHAAICPTCRRPLEVCRQKKIDAIMRKAKKGLLGKSKDGYLEPHEVTEAANKATCKKPTERNYNPVIPDWYTP